MHINFNHYHYKTGTRCQDRIYLSLSSCNDKLIVSNLSNNDNSFKSTIFILSFICCYTPTFYTTFTSYRKCTSGLYTYHWLSQEEGSFLSAVLFVTSLRTYMKFLEVIRSHRCEIICIYERNDAGTLLLIQRAKQLKNTQVV